jgi:hypothetical protein
MLRDAGLRKCFENVLVRPFLAEDPGERGVRAAYTVGRVFRIRHGQSDGGCQQAPRRGRVGKRAFQPQVLVLRLPPDPEGALEITGMNPDPDTGKSHFDRRIGGRSGARRQYGVLRVPRVLRGL